jgi:hypothetical protein
MNSRVNAASPAYHRLIELGKSDTDTDTRAAFPTD